jgi:HK97 family phage major capsid protein
MESKSNETIEALKADLKAIQDHADLLDVKLQEKTAETKSEGYFDVMEKALTENFNDIKEVRSGKSVQVKAVGDMTLANLTGAQPKEYNFNTVLIPGQLVNVADLVGSVNIAGGTYTFPREGAGEGSIATQTEGSSKSQRDYDFTMVDVNTDFIAGFTRYSKKMANNLPFLTSFIPNALRRDYFFAENAAFNTVLAGAATASTEVIDDKNKIEMLINEVARLENANFAANGIVVRPSDFYDIMKTEKSTGAGYGLPGSGGVAADGVVRSKNDYQSEGERLEKSVLRARHETANHRFKTWGILKQDFRNKKELHMYVFYAVAVMTQMSIDNGSVLFSVEPKTLRKQNRYYI